MCHSYSMHCMMALVFVSGSRGWKFGSCSGSSTHSCKILTLNTMMSNFPQKQCNPSGCMVWANMHSPLQCIFLIFDIRKCSAVLPGVSVAVKTAEVGVLKSASGAIANYAYTKVMHQGDIGMEHCTLC